MNLFEYIKSQLPQMPNASIMKDMGASDELIEYVKETPWNTNLNVAESIANPGGGRDAEVWLAGIGMTGETEASINNGTFDHMRELYTNGENYQIFLNNIELPTFSRIPESNTITWSNGQNTVKIEYMTDFEDYSASAIFNTPLSATISVEVSVKAK